MTGDVAVRVRDATKTFADGRKALDAVSFEVAAGERVALIGASGSGKSTLLRAICGLERLDPADGGVIELFDRVLQRGGRLAPDIRAQRRSLAMIFQQFNLVGRRDVLTNVLMGLAHEVPVLRAALGAFSLHERARALDALEAVGLGELAFRRAGTLSGGQQQRAAIARSLVQGARVLLADEPVASLDPDATQRVMGLLTRLTSQRGTSLIVSLHDVPLARQYCQRVVALRQGRLMFDGPSEGVTHELLGDIYAGVPPSLEGEP